MKVRDWTRAIALSVLGLVGGFVVGVVLFEGGPGVEALPIVLAVVSAVAAPVVDGRFGRGPGRS
jgi:hypothetical protein